MKYNPFSLENKTIFVTNAYSGIGKAIAIEYSKMDANVIFTGRNAERLNETFIQLEGSNHLQIIADLKMEAQTELLIEQLPFFDGVVHSA